MSARFEQRTALVTGAASGIGAAITRALLKEGAAVAGIDLRDAQPSHLSPGLSRRFTGFTADVSDEHAVIELVELVKDESEITLLFNVAGIGSTTSAADTPVAVWDRVFAVNARGTFLMCKHLIPAMISCGGGSIVNIASIAGLVGLPRRAAYCASKGAVIALTKALAIDHVADSIRVNCVCPGTVDSPWVRRLIDESGESLDELRARQPMRRLGTPDEIAEAALYLASDAAAFVTGTVLTIDGGLTAA